MSNDRNGTRATNPFARPAPRAAALVPRLVSRLYGSADGHLRAQLLSCLLRPLGTLSLAGVAAGAFANFLQYRSSAEVRVALEDAARYSSDQITELARFVEQVSPEAVRQFAALVASNPVGLAAFSASAAALLLQAVSRSSAQRRASAAESADSQAHLAAEALGAAASRPISRIG